MEELVAGLCTKFRLVRMLNLHKSKGPLDIFDDRAYNKYEGFVGRTWLIKNRRNCEGFVGRTWLIKNRRNKVGWTFSCRPFFTQKREQWLIRIAATSKLNIFQRIQI